ncbi:ParB/RepB/Spo0J family partition protein [Desulfonatronovibrio magnus]|uniref:ParB/RepB/Spo0J family partition protein n=1 Tax=Desulfonatronovibrio magnus TaxID=698827 RepID=UPI0005EBF2A2|nr:ParB/RepB/Spo0J family partition protein [Desulfonatronovibrio magnus]
MKIKDKGLGKGLDALIQPDFYEDDEKEKETRQISINKITPNPHQPRKKFDENKILELKESIEIQGVIQPIIVRRNNLGEYQIIAGERRWRASKMAGLKTIPSIVRKYSDTEALTIALIENLQREDLNIIEQAKALDQLKNELNINQEHLAQKIGKSRSNLTNTLRLLNLPSNIQDLVAENKISAGHAKALLGLKNIDVLDEAVDSIINKNLSVRDTELLIKKLNNPDDKKNIQSNTHDKELSKNMSNLIKSKINKNLKVKFKGDKNKGQLVINYSSTDQLQDVLNLFGMHEGNK